MNLYDIGRGPSRSRAVRSPLNHLAGVFFGLGILGVYLGGTDPVSSGVQAGNVHGSYRAYASSDLLGLARIAAARAIDPVADIKVAYPIDTACSLLARGATSDQEEVLPARTVSSDARVLIPSDKKGQVRLDDACANERDGKAQYLLTSSSQLREEMSRKSQPPEFVTVGR